VGPAAERDAMAFVDELLDRLWTGYAALVPTAARVHQLLRERGEVVRHDHVALRTFDLPEVEIEALDRAFVASGYEEAQSYELDEGLVAYHYEHREPSRPKLLVSALLIEQLSSAAQDVIRALVAQVQPGASAHPNFAVSGRHWAISSAAVEALRAESEYAAWVAAFGFRAHHFAVDVDSLRGFAGLAEVNRFLDESGVHIDPAGGAIKGSPATLVEQSSTVADEVDLELIDGTQRVRGGSYELIRRHRRADGTRFEGFTAESARRAGGGPGSRRGC
jgi:hypothetical protein